MADKSSENESYSDLTLRVSEWLSTEGYPLEFCAANILRGKGFRIRQGEYVRGSSQDTVREIDVLASMDGRSEDHLIRIYQLVECKWSQDKPWVVFVSPHSRMAESACAAQVIGSEYGTAIMWAIAGDATIKKMELFSSPERAGFNGREVFSRGNDRFYNSMKSITDLSTMLAKEYDQRPRSKGSLPYACVLVFPVILLEGRLFEAYFCGQEQITKVREAQHIRCHWRGSLTWALHATVDIVTLAHFEEFCGRRAADTGRLVQRVTQEHQQVKACFKAHSLKTLNLETGSRGIVGIPPLLREALSRNPTKKERK